MPDTKVNKGDIQGACNSTVHETKQITPPLLATQRTLSTFELPEIHHRTNKKYFLKEVQKKFYDDTHAFNELKEMGIAHCVDKKEFSNLYNYKYNHMSALPRLSNPDVLQSKLDVFENLQDFEEKRLFTCTLAYKYKFDKEVFRAFIDDEKIYTLVEDDDSLQNHIDYLNLGKVEIRRFIDTSFPIAAMFLQDNSSFKDYQNLGASYCISDNNHDHFDNVIKDMIADTRALPIIIEMLWWQALRKL